MTGPIAAGERAIASRLADQRLIAIKAADESVTSSATLQDDNHLTLSVKPATYQLEMEGVFIAAVAAGFKTVFVGPAGTTGTIGGVGISLSAFHGSTWNASLGWGGSAADAWFRLLGRIVVTTAGTFKLTWAQSASNATATTLYTASYLRMTVIA